MHTGPKPNDNPDKLRFGVKNVFLTHPIAPAYFINSLKQLRETIKISYSHCEDRKFPQSFYVAP